MFVSVMFVVASALSQPSATACPRQPEPSALTSAAFKVPTNGETLLFSAAQSFQSVRYALRIVRPNGAQSASVLLLRLRRRPDCNLHVPAGEWTFRLSRSETEAVFAAVADLERLGDNPDDIVLDGTTVELQRHSRGKLVFDYSSNGLAKERLSKVVLDTVRRHVPPSELPRSYDWRYRLPGTQL